MKKLLLVVVLIPALWLVACKPPATNEPTPAFEKSGKMMQEVGEDAVMMQDGKMMLRKDGSVTMMEEELTLDDGSKVTVDGTVMKSDGSKMKLVEGMIVEMDGDLRFSEKVILDGVQGGPSSEALEAPAAGDTAMLDTAVYANFTDDVLTNGETKVLFFHAAWCPICKDADAKLLSWFPSADFSRSIYKVDYDASTELKARYGVTYQHTFVLVDEQGAMLSKVQGPTDEQLRALLQ